MANPYKIPKYKSKKELGKMLDIAQKNLRKAKTINAKRFWGVRYDRLYNDYFK